MQNAHKRLIVIWLLVTLLVILTGCHHEEREYLADISVPLEGTSAEIVIKEWRWLLGSGAEVYYHNDGKLTLLGKTTGGDDGYCPFKEGKFTLNMEGNELVVRWSFRGSDPEDTWRVKRFALPDT